MIALQERPAAVPAKTLRAPMHVRVSTAGQEDDGTSLEG